MTLNDLTFSFKVTPFFDAEYLRNGTNRDLYTVLFRMTLSDLGWLSKIFNDMKRRAVSVRQLSFLYHMV